MSPPQAKISLYFDIASPWSYLCLVTLLRYRESWNLDLDLKPTFLGGVMDYTGNKPPGSLTFKAPYVSRELQRACEQYGLFITSPPGHPLGLTSLNVMRFLRALKDMESPDTLIQCTLKLFYEFYVIHTSVSSPSLGFFKCLTPTLLSPTRLSEIASASQSPANKERMKSDVKALVDSYGAFGMPWMVATRPRDGEVDSFFGLTQMETMSWWLGEEYVWRGPWADGKPLGRPLAQPNPGGEDITPESNTRSRL